MGNGIETLDRYIVEVTPEEGTQFGGLEQVDVKWVFEVGGSIRSEEEGSSVIGQHTGQLADVTLRIAEMLDEMRRTCPLEAPFRQAEGKGVHLTHRKAGTRPMRSGEGDCVGTVVNAHDRSIVGQETRRFETLPTPDIEHRSGTHPFDHRAVA